MKSLLVVDDDEVSREVLSVFATTAGYTVTVAVSGDAALAALGSKPRHLPDVVLADVQMPGTAGELLATCLRTTCGVSSKLIAMSANSASPKGFDSFIRKPFTQEEFQSAVGASTVKIRQNVPARRDAHCPPVLDESVYRTLQRSLPDADLSALYALCLEDTQRRIERMRHARRAGLTDLYLREAHAIKGSCGFVGAGRLYHLAAELEEQGLERSPEQSLDGDTGTDPLDVLAAEREILRRAVASHRASDVPTKSKQEARSPGP